jgi:DNA-binding transcriptional ArsR family regulator
VKDFFRKMSFKKDQLELTDPRAMRAVAHPVRIELLRALAKEPLTATQCAELVGESPQSCSYHLRTLAKYGFVEPAEAANGKERPWRKTKGGMTWSAHTDPEAARALSATFLARDFRLLQGYLAAPGDAWPEPLYSQTTMRLTYAEAEELTKKVWALLEPYFVANRAEAPEDAQDVWWASFAVPYER